MAVLNNKIEELTVGKAKAELELVKMTEVCDKQQESLDRIEMEGSETTEHAKCSQIGGSDSARRAPGKLGDADMIMSIELLDDQPGDPSFEFSDAVARFISCTWLLNIASQTAILSPTWFEIFGIHHASSIFVP